jgi:hypothetical protein
LQIFSYVRGLDSILKLGWPKTLIAVLVVATVLAPPAQSAENFAQIQAIHGKVLVNKGKGFEAALADTSLNIGDRVLIGAKSGVTIGYVKAGCTATLEKPSVFKVTKSAPCGGELISNSISGAPIVPPIGGGFSAAALGAGAGAGIPAVGWGVAIVLTPILPPASLP